MRRNFFNQKTMAVILSAALAMNVFCGCGGSEKTSDTAAGNQTTDGARELEAVTDSEVSYEETTEETTEEYSEETSASEDMAAAGETMDSLRQESMEESMAESEAVCDVMPIDESVANNGETYKEVEENSFKKVADEPLSTFAADVDTASYANIRRMIEDGYGMEDIPSGAVRIEEMINYFDYNLPTPKKDEPFAVTAEMNVCPWNEDHALMMVGMKTEKIDISQAPPSNLVFLIDVSGSMHDEDKLPLLQKSFTMLAENLTENDRISIVTYAGNDEVVLEGAKGNEYDKISKALNSLEAAGSTNGSDGIITAYEIAEEYFIEGGNNRVILATDGDLNVGITSESGLEKLIEEKKETGVYLSVLGFGTGNINDSNMELLADKGNGNYAYIDSVFEANKVLVQQLGATLFTVAKDVKLQVEFNPALVEGYRLVGYENRTMAAEDFRDDTKDGGEIGAGHCVIALYEVDLKGEDGPKLRYQEEEIEDLPESKYADEYCAVSIRYKEPDGDTSKLLTYPVDTRIKSSVPSEDFRFASYVAWFGMVLTDSENIKEGGIEEIMEGLKELDLEDDAREEFLYLVEKVE